MPAPELNPLTREMCKTVIGDQLSVISFVRAATPSVLNTDH